MRTRTKNIQIKLTTAEHLKVKLYTVKKGVSMQSLFMQIIDKILAESE